MKIVYFGSGEFGLPTLRHLAGGHVVTLVVTQPDRPAGRGKKLTPTPIASWAEASSISQIKPDNVNEPKVIQQIQTLNADALVVIAYGQKLGQDVLRDQFAINLHASLLPKYRGAAPINWAMIRGEPQTGVSVITLASRMDAGLILGQASTPIEPTETAGELHDRLSLLGPSLIENVLAQHARGALQSIEQDETLVTQAPKLSRQDAVLDFSCSAEVIRARVHGLSPWPGCRVVVNGRQLRLHRVESQLVQEAGGSPGKTLGSGAIACGQGSVMPVEIQPVGKRVMTYAEYQRGHEIKAGDVWSSA